MSRFLWFTVYISFANLQHSSNIRKNTAPIQYLNSSRAIAEKYELNDLNYTNVKWQTYFVIGHIKRSARKSVTTCQGTVTKTNSSLVSSVTLTYDSIHNISF